MATGVGTGEVARRLVLATSPRRHRVVLAALRTGETSLHRALQVVSETASVSDADVTAVAEAVLAPSHDGQRVPHRTFMSRLRRAVASVDQRGAAERRAHARSRRGVFGRLTEDGMGCLTVVADADAVAAITDRLDAEARALRGTGDDRTLDQVRCDLATEALLRGHLYSRGIAGSHPATAGAAVSSTAADSAESAESAQSDTSVHIAGPVMGRAVGLVWLVVPFEVATGDSDAACELPGHGWVTAAHAREVIARPGSVWRTLPVDVTTGRALSRATDAYRPTAAMAEHVRAVDGTCRGPGCEVVATRCDLDHETPWPVGATAVDNLYAKHRMHHTVKTERIWASQPVAEDGLEWTMLTGRRHTTYPKNWRDGVAARPEVPEPQPPPY